MINKIIHKHHHKISIIFHTFFYIFTYYNDFTNINDYMMFTKTTLSSSFQKCFQKVKRLFKKKKKYNICQLCKIRLCVYTQYTQSVLIEHTMCTVRTLNQNTLNWTLTPSYTYSCTDKCTQGINSIKLYLLNFCKGTFYTFLKLMNYTEDKHTHWMRT